MSNCLHSDLRRIFVLTQYNSESLNKHISQTYKFDVFSDAFVTILAAEQTEAARIGSRALPTRSVRTFATSAASAPATC